MVVPNEPILKNFKDVESLRDLLKSEMLTNDLKEGEVIATIKVYNNAPASPYGGEIVFLGVGLRITDASERGKMKWTSKIKWRPSDHPELRQKYNEGTWVGSTADPFSADKDDEQSYGEELFPGESAVYEITTSKAALPYLDIRVEGSVSRRHLFHISQPIEALKDLTQPLVDETFRALDAIDIYSTLLTVTDMMPAFDTQTTLVDIVAFTVLVAKAKIHVEEVKKELSNVYHSAPNQKLRDYMKNDIGQYLTSATKVCDRTLNALSGSDKKKMKEAAQEMKAHLLKAYEMKRGEAELMSQFGIAF